MAKFGFKEIDRQNWLEPDEISKAFATLSSAGKIQSISGLDWLNRIVEPKLLETVPADVQAIFEVARGALVYGYFFYPLYSLGAEQLLRAADAAVTHRYNALADSKRKATFNDRIKRLVAENVIQQANVQSWDVIREWRNYSSHPEHQAINTPGINIRLLQMVTEKINSLFSST